MWQALTKLSVCFNMYDFRLNATGLTDAIADFWINSPVFEATSRFISGPPAGLLSGRRA